MTTIRNNTFRNCSNKIKIGEECWSDSTSIQWSTTGTDSTGSGDWWIYPYIEPFDTCPYPYQYIWKIQMSCPNCGCCIECGDKYCKHCGHQLIKHCPHCGKEL